MSPVGKLPAADGAWGARHDMWTHAAPCLVAWHASSAQHPDRQGCGAAVIRRGSWSRAGPRVLLVLSSTWCRLMAIEECTGGCLAGWIGCLWRTELPPGQLASVRHTRRDWCGQLEHRRPSPLIPCRAVGGPGRGAGEARGGGACGALQLTPPATPTTRSQSRARRMGLIQSRSQRRGCGAIGGGNWVWAGGGRTATAGVAAPSTAPRLACADHRWARRATVLSSGPPWAVPAVTALDRPQLARDDGEGTVLTVPSRRQHAPSGTRAARERWLCRVPSVLLRLHPHSRKDGKMRPGQGQALVARSGQGGRCKVHIWGAGTS